MADDTSISINAWNADGEPFTPEQVDDIVTRLQEMLDGPVPFVVGREDIREALNEIERITKERNGWQAKAAGISEDLSNAEDEVERLHEEINDLRLKVVSSSIPVTGSIVLIGEDGKEYVLQRDS